MPTQTNVPEVQARPGQVQVVQKRNGSAEADIMAGAAVEINRNVELERLKNSMGSLDEQAAAQDSQLASYQADAANTRQQIADTMYNTVSQDPRSTGTSAEQMQAQIDAGNQQKVQELTGKLAVLKDAEAQGRMSGHEYQIRKDKMVQEYSNRYQYFAQDFRTVADDFAGTAGTHISPATLRAAHGGGLTDEQKRQDDLNAEIEKAGVSWGLDPANNPMHYSYVKNTYQKIGMHKMQEALGSVESPAVTTHMLDGYNGDMLGTFTKIAGKDLMFSPEESAAAGIQQQLHYQNALSGLDKYSSQNGWSKEDYNTAKQRLDSQNETYTNILKTGSIKDLAAAQKQMADNKVGLTAIRQMPTIAALKESGITGEDAWAVIQKTCDTVKSNPTAYKGVHLDATEGGVGDMVGVLTTGVDGTPTPQECAMAKVMLTVASERRMSAANLDLQKRQAAAAGQTSLTPDQKVKQEADLGKANPIENSIDILAKSDNYVDGLNALNKHAIANKEITTRAFTTAWEGGTGVGLKAKFAANEHLTKDTVFKWDPVERAIIGVDRNTSAIVAVGFAPDATGSISDTASRTFGSTSSTDSGYGPTHISKEVRLAKLQRKGYGVPTSLNQPVAMSDEMNGIASYAGALSLNSKSIDKEGLAGSDAPTSISDLVNQLNELAASGSNRTTITGVTIGGKNYAPNPLPAKANTGEAPAEPAAPTPEDIQGIFQGIESGDQGDFGADGKPLKSKAGALYAMQVMPAAAKDPGFGIAPAAKKSPEEYNRVGKALISKYHELFNGDITKIAAAYNWGYGNLTRSIAKYGVNWMHDPEIPIETRKYIAKALEQAGGS